MDAVDVRRLSSLELGDDWGDMKCLQTVGALRRLTVSGWKKGFYLEPLAAVKTFTGLTALVMGCCGERPEIIPLSDYFTCLTALRTLKIDGILDPCRSLLQPFSSLSRCLSY